MPSVWVRSGPTHQPVEQEAQIRLLEKLKNHSGKPSILAPPTGRCRRNHRSLETRP